MKTLKTIIGLALVASALTFSPSRAADLTPTPATTVTCSTLLPTQTAQSILSSATIPSGTLRVVGTNVIIEGHAKIIIPLNQIGNLANINTCTGAYPSNLVGGSFSQATNGWNITTTFKLVH